jgi:hypothetical protein
VRLLILTTVATVAAAAQTPRVVTKQPTNTSDDARVKALTERVAELQKKLDALETYVYSLAIDSVFPNLPSREINIDPGSLHGFQRLDLGSGFVFVSLDSVEPYLDGFKLALDIGNPLAADYVGFTLKPEWGKKWDFKSNYAEWKKTLHSKTEKFTDTLRRGAWTRVTLILPDIKPSEFSHLQLTMETDVMSLSR